MKTLKSLLGVVALSVVGGGLVRGDEPGSATKPNVVIVFIDDLGYGDIGPFGATKQKTPHLDRMASEGMKLTSFYAAPVCSVSRAQLMTGCYGARVSVPGVFPPASKAGLHPQETTIAERLKTLGYSTMCIGKWHLGDHPDLLPTRQGFDRYLGIPYSNDMQRAAKETGQKVVPLVRDQQVVELLTDEQQSHLVERYTAEAVSFIRENAARPFFLYFPHTAVHTPIWPGEAFRGRSANGRFGDWVEEVDWSVGQVLTTLRELKLERNTLVVFTSDNGPWLIKGPDGGSALPLRGGKGSTWEGGVRVPTIAWWPGRVAPGSVCDAVAGTIDLLPTAVSVAGGVVPAEPVIDGRDLSPLLLGKSTESPRSAHYYFAGYNLQAVRQGPWKLALQPQPEVAGLAEDARQNPRLYNLEREIGERTNLAEQHPEIVRQLQSLAAGMNAAIGGETPSERRPAAEVADPRTLYPSEPVAKPTEKKNGQKNAKKDGQKKNASRRGIIETVAGDGTAKPRGDGGPAAEFPVGQPFGVEVGPDGALYITEVQNHRVLKLDLKTKQITTVAGTGRKGYSGDGGPATKAELNEPYEVRFDAEGNMFFVEMQNHLIRRVDARTGIISTIAGTGQPGFGGDGGPAIQAQFKQPHSLALDGRGGIYVADIGNHRIRRIDLPTGRIETIAGTERKTLPQDGQVAIGNPVLGPRALFVDGRMMWVALREGHSVWKIDLDEGTWRHVSGTGKKGFTGDGGPAKDATFDGPKGIAVGPGGNVFVVDTENHAIRKIDTKTGTISTIAGMGPKEGGFGGDGGPATAGKLARPHGVCVGPGGEVYVGDTENHRVRRVN